MCLGVIVYSRVFRSYCLQSCVKELLFTVMCYVLRMRINDIGWHGGLTVESIVNTSFKGNSESQVFNPLKFCLSA